MKYFIASILLCGVIAMCNGECTKGVYDYGVSKEEQDYIVEEHNRLRLLLAHGKVPGQPRAINLKRFAWDDYLAGQAQNIANTCDYGHKEVKDSRWPIFGVGQNIAQSKNTEFIKGANWTYPTTAWWSEYKKYHYPDSSTLPVSHYTQMAWANTKYIGCGYTHYPIEGKFKYMKFYVCNYGPGGNYQGPPYETGPSGGSCDNLC